MRENKQFTFVKCFLENAKQITKVFSLRATRAVQGGGNYIAVVFEENKLCGNSRWSPWSALFVKNWILLSVKIQHNNRMQCQFFFLWKWKHTYMLTDTLVTLNAGELSNFRWWFQGPQKFVIFLGVIWEGSRGEP